MKKYFIFCNGVFVGVYYGRNIWEGEMIEFYIESYKNLGIGGSDPVAVVEQKDFGEFTAEWR